MCGWSWPCTWLPGRGAVRLAWLGAGLTVLAGVTAASASNASTGSLQVEMADGLVTVKAIDVPVKDVLGEVVRQNGILLDLRDPLDERINLALDRRPLLEVLERILAGRNFALRYFEPMSGPGSSSELRQSRLWVFSREPGEDSAPFGRTGEPRDGPEASEAVESLSRLTAAMTDDDAKVRLEAVSELADIGSDQAAADLASAALFDEASSVREEALHGLREIGERIDRKVFWQALMDPDRRVRKAAVDVVADIGGDDSARALAFVLDDDDVSVREDTVYALGEIGGEVALGLLKQALTDEQSSIREAAADVLAELSGEE